MKWDENLENYLASVYTTKSDREIAADLFAMTGEVVSKGAITIKRKRLGLLRRPAFPGKGRSFGTKWNDANRM